MVLETAEMDQMRLSVQFMVSGAPGRDGQHVLSLVEGVFKEEKDLAPILPLRMEENTVLEISLIEETVTWVNVK